MSEKKVVTLRVKKKFFDMIENSEKTSEYRKECPYYDNKFLKKPTHLRLHYQQLVMIECEIKKITKIKTPSHFKLIHTPNCYKIDLVENSCVRI